jgi:hypothetical protein
VESEEEKDRTLRGVQLASDDNVEGLSPFVLGIFSLELLFDTWIVFLPEAGQITGDLHRALTGGKYMD